MALERLQTDLQRNLHGQVVKEIGTQILSGQLKPGSLLFDEETLGARFAVSRTVVREAIKILAAKGLVESRPKRGTIVRPVQFWSRLDPDILMWQGNSTSGWEFLRNLMEVREIVEPPATQLAAQRATPEEVAIISQAYHDMVESVEDPEVFMQADMRFHAAILQASHNEFLQPIANAIRAAMFSSLRITNRGAALNKKSLPLHFGILEAVREKAPDAAAAMRRHLQDTLTRLKKENPTL